MSDQDEEIKEIESDGLLGQSKKQLQKKQQYKKFFRILSAFSISLNIFFVGFAVAYWIIKNQIIEPSYENGFTSDLGPVKPEIQLTEYIFTGGIGLDEEGNYYMDPKSQQYGGVPSPEVDDAWHLLTDGLNIGLDGSDASLDDRTFRWPGSGDYFTGLEVFHSLHCLDRLRQALYPGHYHVFDDPKNPSRQDHIEHCINHLRQAIQCHSDLTPMEWHRVGDKIILNTETRHTCRDFEKIHDWAKRRKAAIRDREDIEAMKNGSLFIVD